MPSAKVCVLGASNLDLVSYVPRMPRWGETLHGSRFQMGHGGKGANQAVMAANLGANVALITKLGNDPFGADMLESFRRRGIDTRFVFSTDEAFTGVAPIAVDPAGNNAIIIVTGANDLLTVAEIEAARPAIAASGVLVCQLEIPVETTAAAMRVARESGVMTVLNPAPARDDLPDELFQLADVFCPNQPETELITGRPAESPEEAESTAAELFARGAGRVVLTLGERGSLLVDQSGATHVPGVPVRAVDTTGAGDAFVGSLAFFLARGVPIADAMRRSNRIAAISVQRPGTQASFPTVEELPEDLVVCNRDNEG